MPGPYSVKFNFDLPLKMRDGTTLYADVFRPDTSDSVPALLQRTPYDKSSPASRTGTLDAVRAAMNGYAVVIQDVRGRYASEGEFYTFMNEINDGSDTIEWLAGQPWCSGSVGMYGVSYVGATQWLAAKSGVSQLKGIAPGVTASDYHEGWAWQGGAFELGFNLSWAIGALTTANWGNLSRRLSLDGGGLDLRKMTLQEVAVLGSYTYTKADFAGTLAAMAEGRFGALDWFETRTLSEGGGAFAELAAGREAAAKIVLRPE